MNRLTTTAVSEIKACAGIYRASDVARNYGVHRSTVVRIWQSKVHRHIRSAGDFPDLHVKPSRQDLAEELDILIRYRGKSIDQAADELGIARSTAYLLRGLFI